MDARTPCQKKYIRDVRTVKNAISMDDSISGYVDQECIDLNSNLGVNKLTDFYVIIARQ